MIRILFVFLIFVSHVNYALSEKCVGKIINPVTDICWSCLFPISIGSSTIVKGGKDSKNPSQTFCECNKPPLGMQIGIPLGFWEPIAMVDVTRIPYCMINMGGIVIAKSKISKMGDVGLTIENNALNSSFYHVHFYKYPIISFLELIKDFVCLEKGDINLAYMSELDPAWDDNELSNILNPESTLFANVSSVTACALDCELSESGMGNDNLYWCAGCNGSVFPFTGHVAYHRSGLQASTLLTARVLSILHRGFMLENTSGSKALCGPRICPNLKKSQYKLQMIYPVSVNSGNYACNPLGQSERLFSEGKEFPYKGEDFGYVIWRKRNCCARAT